MTQSEPTVGTGEWSFVGASGGAVITNASSPTTTVTSVPFDQNITVRWTVTNGTCVASDDVVLHNDEMPVVSDQPNQTLCNTSTFTMTQSAPTVGTGEWSFVGASGGAVITNASSPTTTVTSVPFDQNITVRWTVTNGTCVASDDVVLHNDEMPVVSDQPNQTLCNTSTFTMTQSAPTVGTGEWSFVGASGGAVITNASSPTTTVTSVPFDQNITVRWTVTNGTCVASDDVVLHNDEMPVVSDQPNQTLCNTSTFTMTQSAPTVGTGEWSFVGASGGAVITNASSPTTTVTSVPFDQNITVRWTVTNGTCVASDDVVLHNDEMPVVSDQPNQTLCNTSTFTMTQSAPTVGTGEWSFVGASGGAVITNASSPTTTVTSVPFDQNITVRWTVTNGTCVASDDVVLHNDEMPVVSDQPNQTLCNTSTFTMTQSAPTVGTGEWSFVGASGGAVITNASSPTTTVTSVPFDQNITVRWTVTNGTCVASDDVVLHNDEMPVVSDQPNQTLCNTSTFTMTQSAPTVGTGEWSFVGASGGAVITNASSPTTTVTSVPFDQNITVRWTVTNGTCVASDDVVLHNDEMPVVSDQPNQTLCNTSTFTMTQSAPTVGTGEWSFVGASGGAVITNASSPTTTVTSVPFDQNITVRWTVTNGTCVASDDVVLHNDEMPVVSDQPNQTLCNTSTFTMTQSAPTVGTGEWSFVGASGGAVITNASSPTTTVTSVPFDQNITVRWTVTNGTCVASDDVVLHNDEMPVVSDQPNQTLCNTSTFTMTQSAPTVGTGEWSFVGASGGAVITNASSPTTTVTSVPFDQNITVRWTVTNGTCVASDDVVLHND